MDLDKILNDAVSILKRRGKASYSALKLELSIDDQVLAVVREELTDVLEIARDLNDKMLVLRQPKEITLEDEQKQGSRRVLTVMFCDLVGSTQLSSLLDSEDFRDVLRDYQRVAVSAINHYDGYVAQYRGDGVLAYFGFPRLHEFDAVRAVRASVEIIDSLEILNERLKIKFSIELKARIGIHSGEVVIDDVGAAHKTETLALGKVPNIAARLESLAAENQIVISRDTKNILGNRVNVEAMGKFDLKGVEEAQEAYRVLSVINDKLADIKNDEDFVGRRDKLATLVDEWNNLLVCREGAAICIYGEAGLGKTRILRRFIESTALPEHDYLVFSGQGETRFSSLKPILEGLAKKWRFTRESSTLTYEQLEKTMTGASGIDIMLIAEAFGVTLPTDKNLPKFTPQVQRHLTLLAMCNALLNVERPSVLLFEDLHWLDPTTHEFLLSLLSQIKNKPVLLLMTSRPTFKSSWNDEQVKRICLSPLDYDDGVELIKKTSGAKEIPRELLERINQRAEGNPLFIKELTKSVFESGRVKIDDEGYAYLRGELDDNLVPVTVYGCLMARLDDMHLSRQVVQLAAVIGARFSFGLIKESSELGEIKLKQAIAELIESKIISAYEREGSVTYQFSHALLRDAIERSLLRATRKALHSSVANALIKAFPEIVKREPERVALHLDEAGRKEEGIAFWREAGINAMNKFANVEAITHYSRALDSLKRMPQSKQRDATELTLTMLRATPMMLTQGWGSAEVRKSYEHARSLRQQIDEQSLPELFPVLVGLASYYIVIADWQEAEKLTQQNWMLAKQIGRNDLLLEAEAELGVVKAYAGDHREAISVLESALERFDAVDYADRLISYGRNPATVAHTALAMMYWLDGRVDSGMQSAQLALEKAKLYYHPFSITWAYCACVVVHLLREEIEQAKHYVEELCQFAQDQGFPYWLGQGLIYRGWIFALEGDAKKAMEECQIGFDIFYKSGSRMLDPLLKYPMAKAKLLDGDYQGALDIVDESIHFIKTTGECWFETIMENLRGEILAALYVTDSEKALNAFQYTYQIANERNIFTMKLQAALNIAQIFKSRQEPVKALQILEPLQQQIKQGQGTPLFMRLEKLVAELKLDQSSVTHH